MEIFDYICDIPDEYLQCKIVKMTMQPVIENAIIHGIEPTGTYGEIRLTVGEDKGDLYISVEDKDVYKRKALGRQSRKKAVFIPKGSGHRFFSG